jgi:flagellar hook-basal body complex protein FliE
MDVRSTFAAETYARAKPATAPEPEGGGIGDSLGRAVQSFTETLSRGEDVARGARSGGGGTKALVQALASSQMAVETVATVRDKVVEAYQEILRMPV